MKTVIIIGGGASGMVAAVSAARHGADVILIEHKDRIGKKILSTGNGKCNYTNRKQGLRYYRGENPAFVLPVFKQFGFEETVAFFRELGIVPKERNGYFYPASGQASSVLDALRMELRRLSVRILTECEIRDIQKKGRFFVGTKTGVFSADSCIFACGGLAFPKSGSDGSAFPYIEKLGHTMVEVVPALVQMKANQAFFKSVAGIRADCEISLKIDGRIVCSDRGEIQLTKDGVSGIPSFQVSRYAARALLNKKKVSASLDFAPDFTKEGLRRELMERFLRKDGKTCEEAMIGFFPKNLNLLFLKECGIALRESADQLEKTQIERLCAKIKDVTVDITGTEGFDRAQTSAGGVRTDELNADTLESHFVQGLYFAGEVIDVDGMCGGYNLQWAWSSGYVAGMHAALKQET